MDEHEPQDWSPDWSPSSWDSALPPPDPRWYRLWLAVRRVLRRRRSRP